MKLETKIVVTPRYSREIESDICISRMNGFLYPVIIGQEISQYVDGKHLLMKVLNVTDNVSEVAVYRYVEVVIIDTNIR